MKFLTLAVVVLSSLPAFSGEVVKRSLQDATFKSDDDCHLTRFSVSTFDTQINREAARPGQFSVFLNTTMGAVWETNKPECVKDYGVVQYIRGCIYSVEYDPETKTEDKYFGIVRELRNKNAVRFQHKDWEVDTIDIDPLYNSYSKEDATESNRLHYQKFAKSPLALKADNESLAKDQNIYFNSKNYNWMMNLDFSLRQLFTTDLPTGSDYAKNVAAGKDWVSVSSLEFKTCLYKLKDVPLMGDPASFDTDHENGGPIKCYDWSDKAEVDYKNKTLKRTDKLDSFCFDGVEK